MADTRRTKNSLLSLYADNETGEISAQDLRDFVVTSFPTFSVSTPSAINDNTQGYDIGSLWACTATDPVTLYICTSSDTGSAVWDTLGIDESTFVNVSGDTMTGGLIINSTLDVTGLTTLNTMALDTTSYTTGAFPSHQEGLLFYDADEKTLALYNDQNDVTHQLGREIMIRVVNKTGSAISNGQLVYINGSQGNRPTIALAKSDIDASAHVIGMATHDIPNNQNGYITTFGLVHGIDTAGYSEGTFLYLSADTSGEFTDTPPSFPDYIVSIGVVLNEDDEEGEVFINVGLDYTGSITINQVGVKGNVTIGGDLVVGTGDTTLLATSATSLSLSSTIYAPNIGTGVDNSVVILDSDGRLKTDEIDGRVWGTTLVDGANGVNNRIATFTDSNSITGEANLTFDGSTLTVSGSATVDGLSLDGTTLSSTADIILNPTGEDVYPQELDMNLGTLTNKWLTLHARELWVETLVAQEVAATMGGRILVGRTTQLAADVSSVSTNIPVKHQLTTPTQYVYLSSFTGAGAQFEVMKVTSFLSEFEGIYYYTVDRNEDGSGANAWKEGDSVFQLGTGFMDIYSENNLKTTGSTGPTIVGNVRTSDTNWDDFGEHWALGNLDGLYGYGTDTYGVGLGKYAIDTSYLTIDDTNGIKFYSNNTLSSEWNPSGIITLGSSASNHSIISTSGMAIYNSSTKLADYTSSSITLGDVSNEHVLINTGGVSIKDGSTQLSNFGSTVTIGQVSAGNGNVYIDSSGNVALRTNTTSSIFLSSAGNISLTNELNVGTGGSIVVSTTGGELGISSNDKSFYLDNSNNTRLIEIGDISDISLTGTTVAITNGSFETTGSGIPGWVLITTGTGTIAHASSYSHTGSYSAFATIDSGYSGLTPAYGNSSMYQSAIPLSGITSDSIISCSFWVYGVDVEGNVYQNSKSKIDCTILGCDSSGGTYTEIVSKEDEPVIDGTWKQVRVSGNLGSAYNYVQIRFDFYTYYDDAPALAYDGQVFLDDVAVVTNLRKFNVTPDSITMFYSPDQYILMDTDSLVLKGGSGEFSNLTVNSNLEVNGTLTIVGDIEATSLSPYTTTPENIGTTGSAGDVSQYSRGNHVHAITSGVVSSLVDSRYLIKSNNLSDVGSASTSRTNLGLGTSNSPTFAGLTINGSITVSGNVDGVDVSALKSDVDGFPDGLKNLATAEIQQLENIGSTTVSSTQWGYLGGLDQALATTSSPTFANLSVSGAITTTGNITTSSMTVNGDLTVLGSEFIANVEEVKIKDNLLLINSGETGSGVTAGYAGIEVDRGTLDNYWFVFNESSDDFRVGTTGDTQSVATRQDAPSVAGVAYWNNTEYRFDTSGTFVFSSGKLGIGTTSPSYGSIDIRQGGTTVNDGISLVATSQSTGRFYINSDNRLVINRAGTDKIFITSDGDVGIRTSGVSEMLTVNGSLLLGSTTNSTTGALRYSSNTDLEFYNGTNWEVLNRAEYDDEPTGFINRTDSEITFTSSSRTLSIEPTGDSFSFFVTGERFIKTSADTESVVISDTEGMHYIYYDDDGVLKSASNPSSSILDVVIRTKALVSILYWDATNKLGIYVGEERHGITMDGQTHIYLHYRNGLSYVSGLGLDNILTDESGDLDSNAQFGVSSGGVSDEDIYILVDEVTSTAGLNTYYRDGADGYWRRQDADGFAIITTGTGRMAWNEYTGTTWKLTEAGTGKYVLCHVFATTEKDNPIIAILGENEYSNKRLAREGATTEINELLLGNIPTPEIRPIATVIFETKSTYTNSVKAIIVSTDDGADYVDFRSSDISRTSGGGDHSSLSNLNVDSHPQYLNIDGRSGGQTAYGGTNSGDDLNLYSTQDATKGYINLADVLYVDEVNDRVGIGTDSPATYAKLHIYGASSEGLRISDNNQARIMLEDTGASTDKKTWEVRSYDDDFSISQINDAQTARTLYLSIDSSGNVGIGTDSPNALLDVQNDSGTSYIYVDAAAGYDSGILFQENSNGKFLLRNDASRDSLSFYDYSISNDAMTIKEGGNVGIGTTNPIYKLDINSSGYDDAIRLVSTDQWVGIIFTDNIGSTQIYGSADKIYIPDSVGIGTASPSAKLDIYNNFSIQLNPTNGYGLYLGRGDLNYIKATNTNGALDIQVDNYIRFDTNSSERMRITSAGNVGIGTDSPNELLHTYGSNSEAHFQSPTNIDVSIDRGATNYRTALNFKTDGVTNWAVGVGDSDEFGDGTEFYIAENAFSTPKLVIDTSGNVGIGTDSPSTNIEISNALDNVSLRLSSLQNDSSHSTSTPFGSVEFYSNDASGAGAGVKSAIRCYPAGTSGGQSFLTFSVSNDSEGNDVEKLTIDSSGDVSIVNDLYVNGGYIQGTDSLTYIKLDNSIGSMLRYDGQYIIANSNNVNLYTNSIARLSIDNSGNVTISGATTLSSTLDVAGGVSFTSGLNLNNTAIKNFILPYRTEISGGNSLIVGWFHNELSNWTLRGGSVSETLTNVTGAGTLSSTYTPGSNGSATRNYQATAAGTAVIEFTGLNLPYYGNGGGALVYICGRTASNYPDSIKLEVMDGNSVWQTIGTDTSIDFTSDGGVWVSSMISGLTLPHKGIRLTLTWDSASSGIWYMSEIGYKHKNSPMGVGAIPFINQDVTFYNDVRLTTNTAQLILPQYNDAATPTLAFGDGDTGFYESSDDSLYFTTAGTARFSLIGVGFGGVASNAGAILNETASSTNPTILPSRGDLNTGVGASAADTMHLIAGSTNIATITTTGIAVTGSLGISSGMTITGDVTIDGKLSATQKSFLINNPTKPDEKLEYGSLEGAENGVYHRGILTNNYIIELPEEWLWLIDENTITVQLTPFGNYQQIYIDKIKDNKIFINIRGLFKSKNKINCHYIVHAERKDVERLKG